VICMGRFNFRYEVKPHRVFEWAATPGFKPYTSMFITDAVLHPAKANLHMLRWILERYTKPGEWVLDPMAGTFSTCILASLLNRNAVGVDLEQRFVELGKQNSALFDRLGELVILQGDARNLTAVLTKGQVYDKIISSPPYADQNARDRKPDTTRNVRGRGNIGAPYQADAVITSPPYADTKKQPAKIDLEKQFCNMETNTRPDTQNRHTPGRQRAIESMVSGYSEEKNNIGNLPYGNVDTVVTSPPFANSNTEAGGEKGKRGVDPRTRVKKDYVDVSKENIGNLPYGKKFDKIILSPPYENAVHPTRQTKDSAIEKLREKGFSEDWIRQHHTQPHGQSTGSGGAGYVDEIISSPPYEEAQKGGGLAAKGSYPNLLHDNEISDRAYSDQTHNFTAGNIGSLKTDNYLQAMLKVYAECFKVLKPGGVMVLITKNFVRSKQIVRLDLDTIELCEKAGFTFLERWYRHLTSFSFWVVLQYRKTGVRVEYEDILVFRKPEHGLS
jgi:16S rRNA G966 N2-methylase RsmD